MARMDFAGVKERFSRLKDRVSRISTARLVVLALVVSVVLTAAVELAAAQKYYATVKVIDGVVLGINPLDDALDFGDIPKGAGQTRFVTIDNDSNRPAYIVVWTVGGISQLIDVDKTRFVLDGRESAQVSFKLKVPPSSPTKSYTGAVLIFRLPYISM